VKKQRQTRRALSVKVTVSETNDLCANIPHAEVRSVDVTAIRQRTGLSQSAFAANIGVPEGTLVNWEQGRRQPSGAAKVLLALLAKKPNLVVQLYPSPQPRQRWAPGPPHRNTMTADERLAEIGEILVTGILRMRESTRLREPCGIMPVLIWHGSTASFEN
jgi:putative transcriptional regulator